MKTGVTVFLVIVTLIAGFVLGLVATEVFDDEDDEEETSSITINEPYDPIINPADFTSTVDNPYYPLVPGTTFTYKETTEDGVADIVVKATNETKVIMGVKCVVVRDTATEDGAVVEDTYDWFSQDKNGNVWYFGEATTSYEDGGAGSTEGSWEAGVGDAKPGIAMPADPIVGMSYRQEYLKGEAEDMGQIVSLNNSITVPYGSFSGLLMTRDWSALEPGVAEHKYYAKGVGVILEELVEGEGSERAELVSVTTA